MTIDTSQLIFMKKNNRLIESIIIFMFFSVLVALINLNDQSIEQDRIWVFHMMQKIASGELIYSEMNVIVGPIFYIIGGIVFRIFGASFIVFDCFSGILYGALAALSYNICKELNEENDKMINLLMIVVLYYFSKILHMASYNAVALFFILLAMLLEIRKCKKEEPKFSNILIGVCVALTFFSKQTVGGIAVIATGLFSLIYGISIEKKNPIKEILEKMLGFFIVFTPIISIMAACGNLLDYIDLCFGSILEFASNNVAIVNPNVYLILMISLILTGVMLFKFRKEDKELLIILIYAIATGFFAIPIVNSYHAHLATFAIWFVLIKIINILKEYKNADAINLLMVVTLVSLVHSIYTLGGEALSQLPEERLLELLSIFNVMMVFIDIVIMALYGIGVIKRSNKFIKTCLTCCGILVCFLWSYNFVKNLDGKVVPESLEIYANHGFRNEELEEIKKVMEYISIKESEGYDVKVISSDASKYMAPMGRNNNKYDLLLSGNLGYNGTLEMLDEIKLLENTIILQNEEIFWQEPEIIKNYIEENCVKLENICGLNVFLKE